MLREMADELDAWVMAQNVEAWEQGLPPLRACTIKLLGQMALLELSAPLILAATKDVDVYDDCEYAVKRQLERILAKRGLELDPLGHEVWMPPETTYQVIFAGSLVTLQVADVEAVLLSKARMAPDKNRALIVQYLAQGASKRFVELAATHAVDLEAFA